MGSAMPLMSASCLAIGPCSQMLQGGAVTISPRFFVLSLDPCIYYSNPGVPEPSLAYQLLGGGSGPRVPLLPPQKSFCWKQSLSVTTEATQGDTPCWNQS